MTFTHLCKLCEILSSLTPAGAEEINDAILDRDVSAEFTAATLSKHTQPVGASTVKKHRKEKHYV